MTRVFILFILSGYLFYPIKGMLLTLVRDGMRRISDRTVPILM